MNQQEKNSVAIAIALTGEYYGRPQKKEVIAMMVSDLEDLSTALVLKAYDDYRKDPKNRTMPLPAQIRAIIKPSVEPDQASREILAKILEAQDRFGYTWPQQAKEFIGEIGWSLIRAYGGWENFCQGLGVHFSVDSFNAQGRELLKTRIIHGDSIGNLVRELPYRTHSYGELEFQDHKQNEINKGQDLLKSLNLISK